MIYVAYNIIISKHCLEQYMQLYERIEKHLCCTIWWFDDLSYHTTTLLSRSGKGWRKKTYYFIDVRKSRVGAEIYGHVREK